MLPNSYYANLKSELDDRIKVKFKILFDGYRNMLDRSLSKSKDLGDILRFLPGVVVQKNISMEGMAELYRVKFDLLVRLIAPPMEALQSSGNFFTYALDEYLSGFFQDRDRSQLYYCDPTFQHISICRHFLSLLNQDGVYLDS